MCDWQVMDIKDTRIDNYLQEMGNTMLCDLPDMLPWSVEEFLSNTEVSALCTTPHYTTLQYDNAI